MLNQELGILIQFAFHDPKQMPDFTRAGREAEGSGGGSGGPRKLSGAQAVEAFRAHLVQMHYHNRKGR